MENWISIQTPDGEMNAFQAAPDAADRHPALIVIQELFGVNAHLEEVCRDFAHEGYVAVAPELFHREGKRVRIPYTEVQKGLPLLAKVSEATFAQDVEATLSTVRQMPNVDPERVAIVGYCMGGYVAFLAACRTSVDAAVVYYGGGLVRPRPRVGFGPILPEADRIRAPMLLFFGEKDSGIPLTDVDAVRGRLEEVDVDHQIVVYPGAQHGFYSSDRDCYHAEAAADSRRRMLSWLKEKL